MENKDSTSTTYTVGNGFATNVSTYCVHRMMCGWCSLRNMLCPVTYPSCTVTPTWDYGKIIEKKLTKTLKEYSLESETLSKAEEMVCEVADRYPLRLLGEALTGIYINCYDQQNVIAGICSSLERFDATEVAPWGQSIVIGLVNHKSDLVKERVISLIENWGDTSLLTVLKNIDISSTWMREYVNGVITYLEAKRGDACEQD